MSRKMKHSCDGCIALKIVPGTQAKCELGHSIDPIHFKPLEFCEKPKGRPALYAAKAKQPKIIIAPEASEIRVEKNGSAKMIVDNYYDVTCAFCNRSRSKDFGHELSHSGYHIRACAKAEGWGIEYNSFRPICPICMKAAVNKE